MRRHELFAPASEFPLSRTGQQPFDLAPHSLCRRSGSTTAAPASVGRHRRSRSGLRWAPLRLESRNGSNS
jgi:hypothetical protein